MIALSEQFLTKTETAAKLGISTATLDRRVKAGVLVPYPHEGKEVVFRAVDVEELSRINLALAGNLPKVYWLSPAYLKQAREEAGISQHDLAQLCGISRGKIANFEIGITSPTLEDAAKLYAVLEDRGSGNALRALVAIAATEKEITELSVRALEREIDSVMERHTLAANLLAEQEAKLTQLMVRLQEHQQIENLATAEGREN